MSPNRKAFLDMIAHSELGPELLAVSDNGYNVMVGSTAAHPRLFKSYANHPHVLVPLGGGLSSTAAGRYQILARNYDAFKEQLGLPDFSPASQDAIALEMIRQRGALPLVDAGAFDSAVKRMAKIWASFPGSGYGQHQSQLVALRKVYQEAGGALA
ncbi:MAG: glycoside hydrolase family 104 protein [Burkholderiaceae bacterium]|jgi:muramidase (phage lysozyme)|nr:glycoside hydrolase family 104 protein [Burkholderiaceae bacterium]